MTNGPDHSMLAHIKTNVHRYISIVPCRSFVFAVYTRPFLQYINSSAAILFHHIYLSIDRDTKTRNVRNVLLGSFPLILPPPRAPPPFPALDITTLWKLPFVCTTISSPILLSRTHSNQTFVIYEFE